jgi:hypothetical protein
MKRALLPPLAALFLTASALPIPPQERYVPVSVERADSHGEDFYEGWFGSQLRAMGEPILSRPDGRGRFATRLRMLVLPSFDHGYAIRIDESASGGLVSLVELTGAGGYAPGQVHRRAHRRLSTDDMRTVHQLVRRADLSSAPVRVPPAPPVETGEGQIITVCADGTMYVFELIDRDGSRFVYRHECEISPALLALASELQTLRPDAGR